MMTAAFLLGMLAACQISTDAPKPGPAIVWKTNVPPLNPELERACRDQGVKPGMGGKWLRSQIAASRQWGACEHRKHMDVVEAYHGVADANSMGPR